MKARCALQDIRSLQKHLNEQIFSGRERHTSVLLLSNLWGNVSVSKDLLSVVVEVPQHGTD